MNVNEVEKVASEVDFVFSAVDMTKEEIKNKGKFALATLLLAFIIGGYCISSLPPEKGVFAFDLPAGYRISEITDKNCSIVDAKGTVIGGVILTDLRAKDIRNLDERRIRLKALSI